MQKPISKKLITLILLLLFVAASTSPVWASEADATVVISSAQNTLVNCYDAAKQAEAAGANITVLMGPLNEAASLLSQAEYAYSISDFDTAVNFATQSQSSLSNVIEDANALQVTASQQQYQDFLINVVGSILGTFAVIVAGFAAWIFLKKRHEATEAK